MKAVAGTLILAAFLTVAALVGPALPGHVVASWWVSAQPRVQATGIGECNKLAQLYRINPDTPVPPDA
jgi:hypothetical protein